MGFQFSCDLVHQTLGDFVHTDTQHNDVKGHQHSLNENPILAFVLTARYISLRVEFCQDVQYCLSATMS